MGGPSLLRHAALWLHLLQGCTGLREFRGGDGFDGVNMVDDFDRFDGFGG